MDKPENVFYKAEIRYESEGDWKDRVNQTLYIEQSAIWLYSSEDEGNVYDEHVHHYRILDMSGDNVYIMNGNLYYMQAMSNAILLKSAETEHYKVSVSEIDWSELPQTHQKKFDNYRWLSEHPIKFHEYPESKYIQVTRAKVPDGIPAERWLYNHSQPFDLVIIWTDNEDEQMLGCAPGKRDNGMYLKDMYTACPICGSREVSMTPFNNLCPEQLAGSAGHDYTCKECGYTYRSVEIMS